MNVVVAALLAVAISDGADTQGNATMTCATDPDTRAMLAELEQARAERDGLAATGVKDSGELGGRILALEEQLARRGCPVRWDGRRYHFTGADAQ